MLKYPGRKARAKEKSDELIKDPRGQLNNGSKSISATNFETLEQLQGAVSAVLADRNERLCRFSQKLSQGFTVHDNPCW